MIRVRSIAATLLVLGMVSPARAHDGPPYPIFVDEDVGGFTLSIWTDPDVGTGTFFYYLEAPPGRSPADVRVEVRSAPADGSSPEVSGRSELADRDEPFQQIGELEFDHRGLWPTHFEVRTNDAAGLLLGELDFDLEVTPPGLGAVDILWFAIPFLMIAGIWLRALLAQRAHDREQTLSTS